MLDIYADTDEPTRFDITDANGDAATWTTAVCRIDTLGEFDIAETETVGVGLATIRVTDTGIFRYQVLVDGVVSEEGQCVVHALIPEEEVS